MLSTADIKHFQEDGFVVLRKAFSEHLAQQSMNVIWKHLAEFGIDPDDRSTWTQPVQRVFCGAEPPLIKVGRLNQLLEAYDQLLGVGSWDAGEAISGSFPIRFPSEQDPKDTGWHIDGSFLGEDGYWVNVHSKGRGLLCLFLFSDIDRMDAPTCLLKGSHRDVPKVLQAFGKEGTSFERVKAKLPEDTFKRERIYATGKAGDVFICHPFLVHAATWPHRGMNVRAIAQAGVSIEGFSLENNGREMPVERSILDAL